MSLEVKDSASKFEESMENIFINVPRIVRKVIAEVAKEWRAKSPSSVIESNGAITFVIQPPLKKISSPSDIFCCTYNPQDHLEKTLTDYYDYLKQLIETHKLADSFLLTPGVNYLEAAARIKLESLLKAASEHFQEAYSELPLMARLVTKSGSPNAKENKRIHDELISTRSKSIKQRAGLRDGRGRPKKSPDNDIRKLIEGRGRLSQYAAAKCLKVDRKTLSRRQKEANCENWNEYLDFLKKGQKKK